MKQPIEAFCHGANGDIQSSPSASCWKLRLCGWIQFDVSQLRDDDA